MPVRHRYINSSICLVYRIVALFDTNVFNITRVHIIRREIDFYGVEKISSRPCVLIGCFCLGSAFRHKPRDKKEQNYKLFHSPEIKVIPLKILTIVNDNL